MKVEATEALPDIRFLDKAARAAGFDDWAHQCRDGDGRTENSVIAHARSLALIEQLERGNEYQRKLTHEALDKCHILVCQRDAALDALKVAKEALAPFAEQKTIDEIMSGDRSDDEFTNATVEGRVALMAKRKDENTRNILSARQAIAQIDAITEGEGL